jgi:hypothetical protein
VHHSRNLCRTRQFSPFRPSFVQTHSNTSGKMTQFALRHVKRPNNPARPFNIILERPHSLRRTSSSYALPVNVWSTCLERRIRADCCPSSLESATVRREEFRFRVKGSRQTLSLAEGIEIATRTCAECWPSERMLC